MSDKDGPDSTTLADHADIAMVVVWLAVFCDYVLMTVFEATLHTYTDHKSNDLNYSGADSYRSCGSSRVFGLRNGLPLQF